MATTVGVGLSVLEDPGAAGREALGLAWPERERAAGEALVLVFLTEAYAPETVLGAIREGAGAAPVVGFTAAGVLAGPEVRRRGVLVGVVRGDDMTFHLDAEEGLRADQRGAGARLGARLAERLEGTEDEALLLLLVDAVSTTVGPLVPALCDHLGTRVKYAGGGAGDNLRSLRTYQFVGDRVLTDAVAAALIISRKPLGVALAHGWRPISPPCIVTRAEANVVRELDWQDAAEVYERLLAEHDPGAAAALPDRVAEVGMRYPLGIPQARAEGRYVIRDVLGRAEDGSLACLGDVPENGVLRIMAAGRQDMLGAAREAAGDAAAALRGKPAAGALVFYCVSRHQLLGEACEEELRAIGEALGPGVPVFGCLTFGEIGSMRDGPPAFQNKSLAVCVFPR